MSPLHVRRKVMKTFIRFLDFGIVYQRAFLSHRGRAAVVFGWVWLPDHRPPTPSVEEKDEKFVPIIGFVY